MEKSVGTLLREARIAKALTLSQVEEKTNIRGNYLEALESDNYSKIPGEVFAKGMIRTYGNFLGLDGNSLVDLYKAKLSGKTVEEIKADDGAIRENKQVKLNISLKQKRDWGTGQGFSLSNLELPWKQIAMGLVAAALLGIMYVAVPKIVDWVKSKPEPAPAVTQVQKDEKPAPEVLADKVEVVIEASDNCWTEVSGDGKELFAGMLKAGDKKTFNAKDKLVIKYGNIGVVRITVNGKLVDLKGEHGVATKTYAIGQPIDNPKEDTRDNVKLPAETPKEIVAPVKTKEASVPITSAPIVEVTKPSAKVENVEPVKVEIKEEPVKAASDQAKASKKSSSKKK